MKKFTTILLFLTVLASPAATFGATATATLIAGVTVLAGGTCTVNNSTLSFGNVIPPITANVDTAFNSLEYICPNGTPLTISLSAGSSGDQLNRKMVDPATSAQIAYNVYTDGAYTTIWGDGTSGTVTQSGTGSGSNQWFYLFGRIPVQPDPTAGNYNDTITITLTY